MLRQDLEKFNLPDSPGVYRFRNEKGEILYIGKATSLRDRVKSYFAKDLFRTRGVHIADMVVLAHDVTFEETKSVLEALVLESLLIKKHRPYYNTKEKDDKSYFCVVFTREEIPRVLLVRQKDLFEKERKALVDGKETPIKKVFGPFPSGPMIREGLKILRKLFPFEDRSSRIRNHQAFYRQLGLSPDAKTSSFKERYEESLDRLCLFLSGKTTRLKQSLQKQMMEHAKREEFEQATKIRNTLFALDHIRDASLIKREELVGVDQTVRIEAYDIAHHQGKSMVGVMTVVENSTPKKRDYRTFHIRGITSANDPGALAQLLLRRFKYLNWGKPDIVVVDGNKVQYAVAEKALTDAGITTHIVAVTKGPDHKPKSFVGNEEVVNMYRDSILLSNSEAHRFAIGFHRRDARKKLITKK